MAKTHSISPAKKLGLLQQSDLWRAWDSLDERRYCVICERTFAGHEIRVSTDQRGMRVAHCPTPHCSSTPREWLHPGNPLLDDSAWQDWLRILDELNEEPESQPAGKDGRRSSGSWVD